MNLAGIPPSVGLEWCHVYHLRPGTPLPPAPADAFPGHFGRGLKSSQWLLDALVLWSDRAAPLSPTDWEWRGSKVQHAEKQGFDNGNTWFWEMELNSIAVSFKMIYAIYIQCTDVFDDLHYAAKLQMCIQLHTCNLTATCGLSLYFVKYIALSIFWL